MQNASASAKTTVEAGAQTPIDEFFIPANASMQERRPCTMKHGDTFAIFDHNGDILAAADSPDGIFHRDTRYLSHLRLAINGRRPMLLSSAVRDDNATLTYDLTNPDLFDQGGKLVLSHGLIHMRRSRFLWNGRCHERLTVKNYDEQPQVLKIELHFGADFADLFEARGAIRSKRGRHLPTNVGSEKVVLSYLGLDNRRRSTEVSFDPQPDKLHTAHAVYDLQLAPHETKSLFIEVACDPVDTGKSGYRSFFFALRDSRRALRASKTRAAFVNSSNTIFDEMAQRSISDLYMLVTDTSEGPYPYAGIPWFSTVFGRDALITAMQTLWLDPEIARGVLCHLAANQASEVDPSSDAEPGKILHEVRYGEMAELGEVPFRRYYGSIDSTPLFLMLAGQYLQRTGDLKTIRHLLPNIERALTWIDHYGDRDGDGFIEYGRLTEDGLINQAWKDSYDSVFHSDGTLAKGPIAIAEVQAYVYGAWQAAADILGYLGHQDRAGSFLERAEGLRRAFDDHFFDDDIGTYVLALDGDKRPCRVRSSNAGHALFAGIAYPERAERVVRTLMNGSSFCGWGIRTIPSMEARYNPMSYHNGSIWPHDNAMIASGLARYGYRGEAARIFEGLFTASTHIDLRRLPELFCGLARQRGQGPTFYPVACSPQAWAATAPLSLLQSCLGLAFDPQTMQISFNEPQLPTFLNEVTLRHLSIGQGSADVALRRSGRHVVVDVLDRQGDVRIHSRV